MLCQWSNPWILKYIYVAPCVSVESDHTQSVVLLNLPLLLAASLYPPADPAQIVTLNAAGAAPLQHWSHRLDVFLLIRAGETGRTQLDTSHFKHTPFEVIKISYPRRFQWSFYVSLFISSKPHIDLWSLRSVKKTCLVLLLLWLMAWS